MEMNVRSMMRRFARACYTHLAMLPLVAIRLLRGRPLLVVSRPGAVGDILATRPALCALKRAHPDHVIVYLTRPGFRDVARLLPEVEHVVGVWKSDSVGEAARRWFDVRFPRYEEEEPGGPSTRHFALEMAQSIGAGGASLDDLHLPGPPRRRAEPPLILIHAGPTAPVREWPAENWSELVRRLRDAGFGNIEQIWFETHFLYRSHQQEPVPGAALLRQPSSMRLAKRLREAALFIGLESGPLHLARAVRAPRVGMCGPTSPAIFALPAPEERICHLALPCQFCHHRRPRLHWQTGCPHDIACMKQLPVETVFAACMELLSAGSA